MHCSLVKAGAFAAGILVLFGGCGGGSESSSVSESEFSEGGGISGDLSAPSRGASGEGTDDDLIGVPLPPELIDDGAGGNAQAGTLTAGDIDDDLNFNFFSDVLLESEDPHVSLLEDRVVFQVGDNGDALNPYLSLHLIQDEIEFYRSKFSTAHRVAFFPSLFELNQSAEIGYEVRHADGEVWGSGSIVLSQLQGEEVNIGLIEKAPTPAPAVPKMDVMFVLDATGSMWDELSYLTTELESVLAGLAITNSHVDFQIGLILYRDHGDAYVVNDLGFMSDVSEVQEALQAQSADGGGDFPEAAYEAFQAAFDSNWREDAHHKLIFHVADAPPHDDKKAALVDMFSHIENTDIKVYPVASSGIDQSTENLMRLTALVSQGRYLFLTDDSGIGNSHKTPAKACYNVSRLDTLIRRVIQSELTGKRVEPTDAEIIRTSGEIENGVCKVIQPLSQATFERINLEFNDEIEYPYLGAFTDQKSFDALWFPNTPIQLNAGETLIVAASGGCPDLSYGINLEMTEYDDRYEISAATGSSAGPGDPVPTAIGYPTAVYRLSSSDKKVEFKDGAYGPCPYDDRDFDEGSARFVFDNVNTWRSQAYQYGPLPEFDVDWETQWLASVPVLIPHSGVNVSFDPEKQSDTMLTVNVDWSAETVVVEDVVSIEYALRAISIDSSPSQIVLEGSAAIASAKLLWERNRLRDYEYEYAISCFCPTRQSVNVTVLDGEVSSVVGSDNEGNRFDPDPNHQLNMGVDSVFAYIDYAIENADVVELAFDSYSGIPTKINIDWHELALDDEMSYRFQPIQRASRN